MLRDGLESVPGVEVGDVLVGKYRVERVLGAGGMGVVVAAKHIALRQKVAIKFMRSDLLVDADAVSRFLREARAAARIGGEHVVRIYDVGTLDNGAPFIVMEYLDGKDLSAWLRETGPVAIEVAVELLLQACEAMAEAHVRGIIHRDLKPANLHLIAQPDGQLALKVLDFGISKAPKESSTISAVSTGTGLQLGSPLYMAPEQMRSAKDVDARADIWSLGVILYELLAGWGRTPFSGRNMVDVALRMATEPPTPLGDHRRHIPAELEAVLAQCLASAPSARFADVGALAIALGPWGGPQARASVKRIQAILGSPPPASSSAQDPPSSRANTRPNAETLFSASTSELDCTDGAVTDQGQPGQAAGKRPARRRIGRPKVGAVLLGGGGVVCVLVALLLARPAPSTRTEANGAARAGSDALVEGDSSAVGNPADMAAISPADQAACNPTHAAICNTSPQTSSSTAAAANGDTAPQASSSTAAIGNTAPQVPTPPRGEPFLAVSGSGASPPSSRTAGFPKHVHGVLDRHALAPVSSKPATAIMVGCDPPYYVDTNGTRHFKRECL